MYGCGIVGMHVYEGALERGRKCNYSEDRLETGLTEQICQ